MSLTAQAQQLSKPLGFTGVTLCFAEQLPNHDSALKENACFLSKQNGRSVSTDSAFVLPTDVVVLATTRGGMLTPTAALPAAPSCPSPAHGP
jgi:hypothetical protein